MSATLPLSDLDALLAAEPTQGPSLTGATGKRCRRHEWVKVGGWPDEPEDGNVYYICDRCHTVRDETRAKRGAQANRYGKAAELKAARKYGGEKIGAAGGPVDIRGADFNTQVKTHRRLPPLEWTKAFAAMSASRERLPRLLLRFLPGPGLPPIDYFVVKAEDWLEWYGRDEVAQRDEDGGR